MKKNIQQKKEKKEERKKKKKESNKLSNFLLPLLRHNTITFNEAMSQRPLVGGRVLRPTCRHHSAAYTEVFRSAQL